jgi:hypothetical protein
VPKPSMKLSRYRTRKQLFDGTSVYVPFVFEFLTQKLNTASQRKLTGAIQACRDELGAVLGRIVRVRYGEGAQ